MSEQISDRAIKQASRGLAKLVSRGGGEMKLTLQPSSLGEVRVSMRVSGGVVSATFEASGDAARESLGTRIAELRAVLESRGVAVERLHVEGFEPRAAEAARSQQGWHGRHSDQSGSREQEASGGNGVDAGTGGDRDDSAGDGAGDGNGGRGSDHRGPSEEPGVAEVDGPADVSGEVSGSGDGVESVIRLNTVV